MLDMFFFNCIRISSPLSNVSFHVDLGLRYALANFDILLCSAMFDNA